MCIRDSPVAAQAPAPTTGGATQYIPAPLAGNIVSISVQQGQSVQVGDVVMILEAMKMETEVRASVAGQVQAVMVREGDTVQVGDNLLALN